MTESNNTHYKTREEQVRAEVSLEQAIQLIRKLGGEYDPNNGIDGCFDAWNQLLACEAIAENPPFPEDYSDTINTGETNDGVSVNGGVGVYAIRKCNGSFKIDFHKHEIITQLKKSKSRLTAPADIAILLEDFFSECPSSKKGYWFDIARYYTPKSINSVLNRIVNAYRPGHTTIREPAAFFTFLIKRHHKRKIPL